MHENNASLARRPRRGRIQGHRRKGKNATHPPWPRSAGGASGTRKADSSRGDVTERQSTSPPSPGCLEMKTLVDSSLWIDHFRRNDDRLIQLLRDDQVLVHPFVVGELACGCLPSRNSVISSLLKLPVAPKLAEDEVLAFVEQHRLYATGIGWIDAHIAASALFAQAQLWTRDRALSRCWAQLSRI